MQMILFLDISKSAYLNAYIMKLEQHQVHNSNRQTFATKLKPIYNILEVLNTHLHRMNDFFKINVTTNEKCTNNRFSY